MRAFLIFCTVLWATSAQARDAIWIEGEDAFDHSFNNHNWYSRVDLALDLLSPGSIGEAPGAPPGDPIAPPALAARCSPARGEIDKACTSLLAGSAGEVRFSFEK